MKTVIITGTSSGIGLELVKIFDSKRLANKINKLDSKSFEEVRKFLKEMI